MALLFAPFASAQTAPDYKADSGWEQICKVEEAKPLATPEFFGPLSASALPTCDEQELYYGFRAKPDYAAALQCGWYQRAHPDDSNANMSYGPGVLAMLYANGKGVKQDYDAALRFSCEEQWVSEMGQRYRTGHLEWLRDHHVANPKFDLCDDDGSGLSQGFCAGIEANFSDAAREKKLNALRRTLPSAAQQAMPVLRKAEDAFEDARVRNEVDLSGTARAASEFEEQSILRDQFLINLQRFRAGDLPSASAEDLAVLDKKLNVAYQVLQTMTPDDSIVGTVTPQGIQHAQRAWLKLLAAWLDFSRVAYPNLPQTSVHAQLIRLRLHQLRSLAPRTQP